MNEATIQIAARHFGHGEPQVSLLGNGLIHCTYKVDYTGAESSKPIVLQSINRHTFHHPENIIHNYRLVAESLSAHNNGGAIASLLPTHSGQWYWIDEQNHFWRATGFVEGSYTLPLPNTSDEVYKTAQCFAGFTRSLKAVDIDELKIIIPHFHDLALRYEQFEKAVSEAGIERLLKSTHIIAELRQRKKLMDFYLHVQQHPSDYLTRVMHHDCKLGNILLSSITHEVLCPVDLDTVMPGLFFSDMGDMVRSMAATRDEESTEWEAININPAFYKAIVDGYLEGMGDALTSEELKHLHYAGLMMVFMQSLRFITDYLNNDTYYRISYPEQNLNRALNQLILLERLEDFLAAEYGIEKDALQVVDYSLPK
jgi:thiamine kinase-like enzyme